MNAKNNSRWDFVRRGALVALTAANAFLLIPPRSGAEEETPAAAAAEKSVRRAARLHSGTPSGKSPAAAPVPVSAAGGERIISVPVSLFRRLSVVPPHRMFDEEAATLSDSGAAILGADAATQREVSAVLRAAARRHASIQRRYASVTRHSATAWTIQISARANGEKTALLKKLEADLLNVLPPGKAACVSALAAHSLLMGIPKDGQTFEIKWSREWVDVSIRSSSCMSNGGMAATLFRKNLKLSWIDDFLPKDGGRELRGN